MLSTYYEDVLGMTGASGVVPLALRRTPQKPTTDPAPMDPAPAVATPAAPQPADPTPAGADSAPATPPKAGKGGRKGAGIE